MYIFNYTKFSKFYIYSFSLCARHFFLGIIRDSYMSASTIFSVSISILIFFCVYSDFSQSSVPFYPHLSGDLIFFSMNVMEIIRNQLFYFLSPLSSNLFIYYYLFNSIPFPCFSRTSNLFFPPFPSLPDVQAEQCTFIITSVPPPTHSLFTNCKVGPQLFLFLEIFFVKVTKSIIAKLSVYLKILILINPVNFLPLAFRTHSTFSLFFSC